MAIATICLTACEMAGKPGTTVPATAMPPSLPHSMKGYELYSWQVDGEWRFTLITGTNRTKSLEEITSGEDVVSQDGWVRIHAEGLEALESLLMRLPGGEELFWAGAQWLQGALADADGLALPPQEMVQEVKARCERRGVVLHVSQ